MLVSVTWLWTESSSGMFRDASSSHAQKATYIFFGWQEGAFFYNLCGPYVQ